MPDNNNYELVSLNNCDDIFGAIYSLRFDLFDQRYNNVETIKELAEKYSTHANVLAIRSADTIRGICVFYDNDQNEKNAFLSMIVISKSNQGHGYGQIMLREMYRICKEAGMTSIHLDVANSNIMAIRFYEKMGYYIEQIGESISRYMVSIT